MLIHDDDRRRIGPSGERVRQRDEHAAPSLKGGTDTASFPQKWLAIPCNSMEAPTVMMISEVTEAFFSGRISTHPSSMPTTIASSTAAGTAR